MRTVCSDILNQIEFKENAKNAALNKWKEKKT